MLANVRHLALFTLMAFTLPAIAQDTSKEKKALQKMYMDYLDGEGYKPEIDSDGDVQFKAEGKTYFINVLEDDPTYFRVVLANIWPIESEEERQQVLVAVDYSNAKAKVTKSYMVKDNVWVGIELFLPKAEDFEAVFARSMSALSNGTTHFVTRMREQQKKE
ncbi:MAG: hypothetical protein ABI432_07455 [Flavobacteriales bacterium]